MAVKNTDRMLDLSRDLLASGVPKYGVGGRRNLIINGAMQVAQRSSSPVTGVNSYNYHAVDRYKIGPSNMGEFTVSQESVTDLPGFTSSLKMECTTIDASPSAADFLIISQRFEGQDLQHLKKGTSDAESVTLSFWVKSSNTGTYVAELSHVAGVQRHINKNFTVDASDTWEYKTITFEGDTTGTIANDNAASIDLNLWLSAGTSYTSGSRQTTWGALDQTTRASSSVNLADTIGQYFEITGIQLEVGETATPFEHRSFGEELALCQRYYQELNIPADYTSHDYNAPACYRSYTLPTTMRANGTAGEVEEIKYWTGGGSAGIAANGTLALFAFVDRFRVNGTGLTNARGLHSGKLSLDAEL